MASHQPRPIVALVAGALRAAAAASAVPPNDACTDAIAVTSGQIVNGTVIDATTDGSASCDTAGNPDVWYTFTAPAAGALTLTTCGTNDAPGLDRGMDTILSVHGSCPATVELACNDNWFAAGMGDACAADDAGVRTDSALDIDLTAGQTILIRVTHKMTFLRDGLFVLHVDFTPTAEPCPCEWDGDAAQVDVFDLLAYLDTWFPESGAIVPPGSGADYDATGNVDVFDLLAYLGCWFTASAGGPCP